MNPIMSDDIIVVPEEPCKSCSGFVPVVRNVVEVELADKKSRIEFVCCVHLQVCYSLFGDERLNP